MTRQLPKHLLFADQTSTAIFLDGRHPSKVSGLHRVRRGTYLDVAEWQAATAQKRYELLVRSTVPQLKRPAPLAHESAAVLLGIPLIGSWPSRVQVLERTRTGGRSSALVVRRATRSMPLFVEVDGILVTSPARTAVDLARTRSFASGLAAADHVLASSLATREELEVELDKTSRSGGHGRARLVVTHADARAESVGESLSRARMIELDLPLPVLQQEFYDEDGFIGRTDFWWPELKLIGEFDGRVKFSRELSPGGDPHEALWQEKQREDRLRRLGNGMVRWTWSQALKTDEFARLLAREGVR
ncbi:type IV toxin-antitoxin system AbiEi family antitoxin [Georgenia sp. H159]|uniref:type IV toxin-antitoxin system AbiEi family antitoxin n=1 Tax=Georgenia sp. H159 TaxID=3076115 RepID=UPI002D788E37|nr:type IV toxin-antitoxin system AbiEi family antitoxin [Georgenia sp. H159]